MPDSPVSVSDKRKKRSSSEKARERPIATKRAKHGKASLPSPHTVFVQFPFYLSAWNKLTEEVTSVTSWLSCDVRC